VIEPAPALVPDARTRSRPGSLLRQLLAWLLVPLVMLLGFNAFLSYRTAVDAANEAYDRLLLASLRAIADRVGVVDDEVRVDVPYVALELFESKSQERIFYRVATADGATLTGYEDLPLPPRPAAGADEPVFWRGIYHDETVYFGALAKALYEASPKGPVLVVVGETAEARDALSREILVDSLARQGLLIAVAALVVWIGLRQGLRPMLRLSGAIARRAPADLAPIDDTGVQREVRPLIDALNQHTARLDKLIAARQRFLDDASHQLRTPLAALKTQAEFGLSGGTPDEMAGRALLADIHRTTDETIRLVNQLLALARAEPQGIVSRDIGDVDLDALARATTTELVPPARQKRIDLGFEGSGGRCMLRGNRTLLHELIVNLVDNAIRYTPAGGHITVRVRGAERGVLEVEDNGPGIPPDERERVFERFYRGSTATSPGSGLGLAIVQDICRSHGARIELTAPVTGTGLRVVVTF
jgi:two-component system sensor histidine kinase TctE